MKGRITALRRILGEGQAALVISSVNRRWLTGFPSSNGYFFLSRNSAVFLTDGRYIEAAEKSISGCEVMLLDQLSEQLRQLCRGAHVAELLCETGISVAAVRRLEAAAGDNIRITPSDRLESLLIRIRSRKSAGEIRKIKEAQRLTEEAFAYILGLIAPGIRERELALELEYYLRKAGSEGAAFDFIALSGENTSKPHGVPGNRKIRKGDFITLDFGAVVDGYRSDMTRTVAVRAVSDRQRQVYETVLQANLAGLQAVAAGVPCAEVDAAARQVIRDAGYGEYFTHSTGHGVGLDIHEPISLSPASGQVLQAGNVVTVEPGIYLPGEFGVRIEDMVLVTKGGCENLTSTPKELMIL